MSGYINLDMATGGVEISEVELLVRANEPPFTVFPRLACPKRIA
jgi:hypothetical protein